MEGETQPSNFPCNYVTAPTSPNHYIDTTIGLDKPESRIYDFEFEISQKFKEHFEVTQSTESHADEPFFNGLITPLKLPLRLQVDTEFNSFRQWSSVSSPKTVCEISFSRRSAWNDDFDPFVAALEKVTEEKSNLRTNQWRSKSFTPFKFVSSFFREMDIWKCYLCWESHPVPVQDQNTSYSRPLVFKGLKYARWGWNENPIKFIYGQIVGSTKARKSFPKKSGEDENEDSKVQNLKGLFSSSSSSRLE